MFERRGELATTKEHAVALNCFETAIEAAHPHRVADETCTLNGNTLTVDDVAYDLATYDRVTVVGGRNTAGHVAAPRERLLGDQIDDGFVVTDDSATTEQVSVPSGSHSVPDAETVENARCVLAVVIGRGSSLMTVPAGDVRLEDVRRVTAACSRRRTLSTS